MRIAVSGTHCSGKTTLVEDFVSANPEYIHEPEPYEWLSELRPFADDPDAHDFYRQLEFSVERLSVYGADANVIAERSPLDFLAYLLALDASDLIAPATELVDRGLEHVDLLVILPLNDVDGIPAPESENLELREAMNEHLPDLIARIDHPRVIEIHGTRTARVAMLNHAVLQSP